MVFAGRIPEWNYWTKSKQLMQCSNVSDSVIPCQVSLSMEFFRQEYWNKLPFPPPGDLPDPGIEPTSLSSPALAGRFFYHCTTWEASRINGYLSVSHFWESWGTPRGGKLHSKERRPSFSRQSGIYIEPFGSKHLYFNVFKYGIFSSFLCWWNKHPESCCMFKKKVKKALTPKF